VAGRSKGDVPFTPKGRDSVPLGLAGV